MQRKTLRKSESCEILSPASQPLEFSQSFFLATFFHVMHDGLRKRGTSYSWLVIISIIVIQEFLASCWSCQNWGKQKIVCMKYFLPRLYYRQEPPVSRHCRSRKRIHRRCVQLCEVKNLVFKWGWNLDKGWYLWGDLKQNLWSKITRVMVNQRSPMNLWPWEWIHWFLWFTMIWVILDRWSWSGSHQRKAT